MGLSDILERQKAEQQKIADNIKRLEAILPVFNEVQAILTEEDMDILDVYPEWRRQPSNAEEVRKQIDELLKERGVTANELFPDHSNNDHQFEAIGVVKKPRAKRGEASRDVNPDDPNTFDSIEWKKHGLSFKTYPAGEQGTIRGDDGTEWKYGGRGKLPDGLKEFRIRLYEQGVKEIPYAE